MITMIATAELQEKIKKELLEEVNEEKIKELIEKVKTINDNRRTNPDTN